MLELVTGGSGSGKSAYAESRICELNQQRPAPLFYIATMYPYGEETRKKIERHRILRSGKGFETLEWYTGFEEHLEEYSLEGADVLLECMSNYTANEIYMETGAGPQAEQAIVKGIAKLQEQCANLVIVTNEVFSESVPDTAEMKEYKRILGRVNCEIAKRADQVTEVVYGIPKQMKLAGQRNEILKERREKDPGEQDMRENRNLTIYIGGAFQGKAAYAGQQYPELKLTDGANCKLEELQICRGMNQFHSFTRRWLAEGRTKEFLLEVIEKNENLQLLISDEIGYGLVPVDDFEREYREFHGRIMTEVAEIAKRVERIVCGIPNRIK